MALHEIFIKLILCVFFIRKTLFIKYKKHKKYNIFCKFNNIFQNLIFDVFSKVIILVFVYNEKKYCDKV